MDTELLGFQKMMAEATMAEYDSLAPELRAAVQEYGEIPWDIFMNVDKYIALQEGIRRRRQNAMLEMIGV